MEYKASYVYDLAACKAQYRALRERGMYRFFFAYLFLGFVSLNAWPMFSQKSPATFEQVILLIVVPLLSVAAMYFFWTTGMPRLTLRNCATSGRRLDFAVNNDGLTLERDDGVKEHWPWRSLNGISHLSDGSASIVWIASNVGFILPRSAFQSSDEYDSARDFIAEKFGGTGYKTERSERQTMSAKGQ